MNPLDILFEEIQSHAFIKFLDNPKKLALYGAGKDCEWLLKNAEPFNLPIEIIIDTHKEGNLKGIPIVQAEDFFHNKDYKQYKFMLTTTSYAYPIGRDLSARGIHMEDMYLPQRNCLINGHGMGDFALAKVYFSVLDMKVHKEHYYHVYNHLIDEDSQKIFVAILRWRAFGQYDLDKDLYASDASYFHNKYVKLDEHECYVDVGAFHGDSVIDFLMKTGHKYSKIYAIEGNAKSCSMLKDKLHIEYEKGNLEVFNLGAGSRRETVLYDGYVSGQGLEKLEIYPIDELLKDKKISLIKMDIEGMELEAIEGAKRIIQQQKPKLAICVYHLVKDIWEIQEKLMDLVPEYKFCLEQSFNDEMHETVLYAFL